MSDFNNCKRQRENENASAKKTPRLNPEVFVWIHNDIFAASPQIERLSAG